MKTATNLEVYDHIIIGQGLAGSALAYLLHKRGAKVCVIQDPAGPSSSRVAAGLYNPVTGRKMVKTWNADTLFPAMYDFYRDAEKITGRSFLHDMPIYRPFASYEEQNEWMGKSASPEYSDYVQDVRTSPTLDWANDPYGGICLKRSGYLDINAYLDAMRLWMSGNITYIDKYIDHSAIEVSNDHVKVMNVKASHVTFCEGTLAAGDRYFGWLPFRPVKGEVLEIRMDVETNEILNRGVFILPVGGNRFRVGSTYDNHDHSWEPTEEGKMKITAQLDKLISKPYSITGHRAGIRPATADRRPIVGKHPEWETLSVLNGLGTKGVTLAPFAAEQLVKWLLDGVEPMTEVNINRYFSLY